MKKERVFNYIKQAVDQLVEQNHFDTGDEFRLTQREALQAYAGHLSDPNSSLEEKLAGFFEIPTGIGKTALFLSIIGGAYKAAQKNGEEFYSAIVVPRNVLLNDTKNEDAAHFIPDLWDEIGLYGDGHRTLNKAIQILTYPAFDKLTKEGKIGPHNIDLLVTDESHRGTSENMADNVLSVYENTDTAMLGFTATSEFDDEKSVLNTHKRNIYSKKIGQAIKEGRQLAEYVQTQNYVIRVEPHEEEELTDLFGAAVLNDQSNYKSRLKQAAWNKAMTRVLRDGRDQRTGDPLTDNQGAFYTQDTTHADALEKSLNNDPILAQRAAAQGYKRVAVSIHSRKGNKKQREQLIKDYKAGKYMMLVGDSMFKEGFNHKPMKTVFDYMRGSLVDKAQIVGRGARRWWNEAKQRSEGLTFIDSIVYIGSDDPEEDATNEARARRGAITAASVLEGNAYVLGPEIEYAEQQAKNQGKKRGVSANVIFPDDDNIREYSDLESLKLFAAEQEDFNKGRFEGYIDLTDEMYNTLQDHKKRTNVALRKLLRLYKDTVPEDYNNVGTLAEYLYKKPKSIHPDLWNWFITSFEDLPSISATIPFTDEMHKLLIHHRERTGVTQANILTSDDEMPEGLKVSKISSFFAEKNPKTIRSDYWNFMIKVYKKLPDVEKHDVKKVTEKMRKKLIYEQERAGVGATRLLNENDAPEGLNVSMINNLIAVSTKSIRASYWDWIFDTYKKYPTVSPKIPFSEDMKKKLISERKRTGERGDSLIEKADKAPPQGLTSSNINSYMTKKRKSIRKDYWDWIVKSYKSLPDSSSGSFIKLTDEMRKKILAERERTQVKPDRLLAAIPDDVPAGLTKGKIAYFFSDTAQRVHKKYWDWAIKVYETLPTKIKVTDTMAEELSAEKKRTGVGATRLLTKYEGHIPDGLSESHVNNYMRKGNNYFTLKQHWDWTIASYKSLPDKSIPLDQKPSNNNTPPSDQLAL